MLEYIINASIIGLVIKVFPVCINMRFDDRLAIGLYIMSLTMSASHPESFNQYVTAGFFMPEIVTSIYY